MSQSINDILCSAWHKSGLTQAQLSERSGVPLSSLNNYLTGKTQRPPADAVDSILSATAECEQAEQTDEENSCIACKNLARMEQGIADIRKDIASLSEQVKAEHAELMGVSARMIRKEFIEKSLIFIGFITVCLCIIMQFH